MLPAALAEEFARDALLTRDGMRAAGIGTRDIGTLVEAGEIVRVARNLCARRGKDSHGWLDHAIACKISGGVLRGPTAGTIHGPFMPHPSRIACDAHGSEGCPPDIHSMSVAGKLIDAQCRCVTRISFPMALQFRACLEMAGSSKLALHS